MDDGLTETARRRFLKGVAAAAGAMAASRAAAQAQAAPQFPADMSPEARARMLAMMNEPRPKVAMLVHPAMVALDLVGPQTVFSLMRADIQLVWKDKLPVASDIRLPITPTATFAEVPADLDVLFIPGGLDGSIALMDDPETLEFLADRGKRARYVTSVCTGALVLGAAGLLKGYSATTHWYVHHLLPLFGATPVHQRVVHDRNRLTGGGVTAGIDFGLTLAGIVKDEATARQIQLMIEYDPAPPYDAGSPAKAGKETVERVLRFRNATIEKARRKAVQMGPRLGVS